MLRPGTSDLNPPQVRKWAEMLAQIASQDSNLSRIRALASALGDAADNAPEPQRKWVVAYVEARLPEWLVEGLRGAIR